MRYHSTGKPAKARESLAKLGIPGSQWLVGGTRPLCAVQFSVSSAKDSDANGHGVSVAPHIGWRGRRRQVESRPCTAE